MSESQKREAKRLVEILIEIGFLKRNSNVGMGDRYSVTNKQMETWVSELTQTIAMYQAEEIEKEMKELPWKPDKPQIMTIEESLKKTEEERKAKKVEPRCINLGK